MWVGAGFGIMLYVFIEVHYVWDARKFYLHSTYWIKCTRAIGVFMLLVETDVHFVRRPRRRDTSLCSKSALVWGHTQIAAELWSTLPHRNTSEAKLTVTLWRPQRYVDKSSCECRLCTHKEGIFHSVFLNLVFILFTFSLDREKGQKAFGAQILRYTPSPVDKAAKYKLNTQKRPVFYNGLKKSSSSPWILQNYLFFKTD